ncbi:hypothetical protein DENSPDRAFT_320370 [Dentipellis sp. KUC8613]|nr:hypothetical protein DENSPDRAFT_320370 [Dentipellis sp. KUC8613]
MSTSTAITLAVLSLSPVTTPVCLRGGQGLGIRSQTHHFASPHVRIQPASSSPLWLSFLDGTDALSSRDQVSSLTHPRSPQRKPPPRATVLHDTLRLRLPPNSNRTLYHPTGHVLRQGIPLRGEL